MDVDSKPPSSVVLERKYNHTKKPPGSKLMVRAALNRLSTSNKRKGVSFYAIKKFIQLNYNVNMTKTIPFLKKYIKKAVNQGVLKQVKGKGMVGCFRLAKISKKKVVKTSTRKIENKKPAGPKVVNKIKGLKITIKKLKGKPQKKEKK